MPMINKQKRESDTNLTLSWRAKRDSAKGFAFEGSRAWRSPIDAKNAPQERFLNASTLAGSNP